jgi:hypothetical protein
MDVRFGEYRRCSLGAVGVHGGKPAHHRSASRLWSGYFDLACQEGLCEDEDRVSQHLVGLSSLPYRLYYNMQNPASH